MNEELWKLIGDRKENRTALIAALIVERCKTVVPEYNGGGTEATFNAHQAQRIASALVSIAGTIHRYAVEDCNRGLTEAEEKRQAKAEEKFTTIAKLAGFGARTGGDPRGACAYLTDPADEKAGDGWGSGWAVYS